MILFFLVLGYKPLSNETYIEFLVVSNKCRREGVGTQLIKYCQRQLLTQKTNAICCCGKYKSH
ncbi:GNAT family N-acetyltransferase [Leuconostoc sp. LN180020]|uniref:GNAT family N-acetyltransferase n=1 Tax=Leuconostoc sp. LN180020 TaxID=2571156 RepID=UPI001FACF97A|nr:GNAT family N-acetyltransferase [Leuconostoc sp. LN180020]